MKTEKRLNTAHIIWKILLIIYLALLVVFGLILIYDGRHFLYPMQRIETISNNRALGYWNANFIPLSHGTVCYIKTAFGMADSFESVNYYTAVVNVFGNLLKFMPLAILLPLAFNGKKIGWVMLRCIIAVLFLETLQFVTMLGYFDIDDILMNILGCTMGYGIYQIIALIQINRQRLTVRLHTA